ncbi:MAG: DUF4296 domain-containing protein [Flavobacteriaceae bacterium]|nr:DUF4296 domain-containing protein [Flavobacteriaceae bacterium]
MKYTLLIILLVIVGCQEVTRPEKPENLIPRDKMIEILADAYIGNAARSVNNRMLRTKGIQLDSILYKKHQIDSLQFASSNAYYTSNLNTYTEMIKEVEQLLTDRKTLLDSLIKVEKEQKEALKDTVTADSLTQNPTLIEPAQDLEE